MAASASSSGCTSSSTVTSDFTGVVSGPDSEPESVEELEVQEKRKVVSLLDRLRPPTTADILRQRKTKTNKPPRGKHQCRGSLTSDPKGVSPSQRVREFDKESLTMSHGHLFCSACREQLSLKRSIIKNHIQSSKHQKSKQRLESKEARERDIADSLRKYNETTHLRGETLPEDQQVYRVKVVTAFLKAGIALNKLDSFRDILEDNAFRLSDRRNMHDYIPFILKEEESHIRSEIQDQQLSVIFDGTSRLGEALAVLLRFVADWRGDCKRANQCTLCYLWYSL